MVVADVNKDRFETRLQQIEQKTNPGKRVQQRVTEDGLVVDVVKSDRRTLLPLKSILMAGVIFILLKSFIFAQLGEPEYLERIDKLSRGSAVEVAAAFLLDADPATKVIGDILKNTLR